ncbi:FecR family protein [Shivajiella indica]|uniref:FecR family protein n=1 Tax=Shivajiella indica TaxID=872115 RepID=A0ABW5BCL9_9BACT
MSYSKKNIEDFFNGRLSKREAEEFMVWINSPKGQKEYEAIIEEVWKVENQTMQADPEKNIVQKELKLKGVAKSKSLYQTKKSIHLGIWFGIAASLLLIFTLRFIFYTPILIENEKATPIEEETFGIVKSTPKGNKKIISLPDGSSVVLNSDSKLTFSSDFIHNRIVRLEGEGFFDVIKDESHPFTVITGNISTTALGTSFNIRSYEESSGIQVSLASGKVRVENTKNKNLIEINPGEAVDYSPQSETLHKKQIDISKILNWKEGILHFDKVPFYQVVLELERWYGVNISIAGTNKIPDYKCTGTFKQHEYLSNVLKVLSYSLDFEYQIKEDNVELKFN